MGSRCVICGEELIFGIDEFDSDGVGRCENCSEDKMVLDCLNSPRTLNYSL